MRGGKLNRLVSIQQQTTTQDEAGQPVPGWAEMASVYAEIRHLSGLETVKADAATSAVKVSIRIRYRTDVTAAMRVVHGATTYEVKAVLPDEAGRQHVDLAAEVITESA